MGTNLRRLGVYGDNLPVKRTRNVVASDFLIGGIMGQFERKYNRSYEIKNVEEFREVFGGHVVPTYYGWDAVKGFFDNAVGVDATLYVAGYVGNAAGVIDADVADRTVADIGSQDSLRIRAGYREEPEYGVGGNRTGVRIVPDTRFETVATAAVAATGVSSAEVASAIGFRVGDIVRFYNGVDTEYVKLTAVNESARTISWAGDLGLAMEADDEITIPGFRIETYRASLTNLVTQVEEGLGRVICTMEPEVVDFYAPNVHSQNRWIVVEDLSSASTAGDRLFTGDTDPVMLTGGSEGTAPAAVAANWDNTLQLFNDDPVRFLANPEETAFAINSAGETYCAGRTDTPIWIATIPEDQSRSQLRTIGNSYQRSDEVAMLIAANWLEVEDVFTTSVIAPPRHVPNCGHVMGAWIRSLGRNGVHFVPAVKTNPIRGILGVVGDQFLDDIQRTQIAEAGVNLIQTLQGVGTVLRNAFTPSTDVAYKFANGILMRNFIKVSAVDSLQTSENKPNSLGRIKADRMAILQFLYRLWDVGSTGNAPTGETFGQTEREDGSVTGPEDHFEVQADAVNNPQSAINAGERNIDVWFSFPSPAGSIKIGVGILLLS